MLSCSEEPWPVQENPRALNCRIENRSTLQGKRTIQNAWNLLLLLIIEEYMGEEIYNFGFFFVHSFAL